MATAKKIQATATTLFSTDAYGGGDSDIAADGAWDYTSNIDLETDGYEGVHIAIEYDSAGTTDDFEVGIFPSLDGSAFDDLPKAIYKFDNNSGADTQVSIKVFDWANLRLGLRTAGTTDTFDARIIHQRWRWDVS